LVNISASYLLHAGSLLVLFFDPEDTGGYVAPKLRLTFNGLQVVVLQKTELFIQIMFKNNVSTSKKALHLHYKHQPAIAVSLSKLSLSLSFLLLPLWSIGHP
jgi:hypothetical protein